MVYLLSSEIAINVRRAALGVVIGPSSKIGNSTD